MFGLGAKSEKKYICITGPWTYNYEQSIWESSEFNNIIFIDVNQLKVDFIVFNADLLIDVSKSKDLNSFNDLLFLRNKSIVRIQYGVESFSNPHDGSII